MRVINLEILGFKSFARKSIFEFGAGITAVVGPNGSGKSNVAEALRFVLGEQSMKLMRGKRTEDLIFNGSRNMERQNRASVTILFDNRDRRFEIDYDEVRITRTIHRDASSEYFLNGSVVRLKDVVELLAVVHIGASGHHIISQGEADRILNASPKDRREMIEDALGLKIYHWRINESDKKLIKTEENMRQTESLRREIAPNIKFLKKQVEKIQQVQSLRDELSAAYGEYFKNEDAYIKHTGEVLEREKEYIKSELIINNEELIISKGYVVSKNGGSIKFVEHYRLDIISKELSILRNERGILSRKIGKFEGMIEYSRQLTTDNKQLIIENKRGGGRNISAEESRIFSTNLYDDLVQLEASEDYLYIKETIRRLREKIKEFLDHGKPPQSSGVQLRNIGEGEIDTLRQELMLLIEDEKILTEKVWQYETQISEINQVIEKKNSESRDAERHLFELSAKKNQLDFRMNMVDEKRSTLSREQIAFEEELREGGILIGKVININRMSDREAVLVEEPRAEQESRRKKIERLKIRLEEMSGIGSSEDILREYESQTERDAFLGRELEDLKNTSETLRTLCKELEGTLGDKFKEGITKINKQFGEFFSLIFNGGVASLELCYPKKVNSNPLEIDDENSQGLEKEGIEVTVSLPHKKIRSLVMLSGGERALTSIALIFAMSQVNPPPFLVLDETDAALDEANSKKYGDMVEILAKHSQLIVITHNRETMSRAGIIYGVVMGSDAISKLLSIKFEEAVVLAK